MRSKSSERLAETLRARRGAQSALARVLGVTSAAVSLWVHGNVTPGVGYRRAIAIQHPDVTIDGWTEPAETDAETAADSAA